MRTALCVGLEFSVQNDAELNAPGPPGTSCVRGTKMSTAVSQCSGSQLQLKTGAAPDFEADKPGTRFKVAGELSGTALYYVTLAGRKVSYLGVPARQIFYQPCRW